MKSLAPINSNRFASKLQHSFFLIYLLCVHLIHLEFVSLVPCRQLLRFRGLSFPTINGSGPNGAIIHYRPKPDTNRPITLNEMYLCDSGAQFLYEINIIASIFHMLIAAIHFCALFYTLLQRWNHRCNPYMALWKPNTTSNRLFYTCS